MPTIERIYTALWEQYGPRGWWPLLKQDEVSREWICAYRPGDPRPPADPLQRFEIGVGAILAQNTAWSGARRALIELKRAGRMDPVSLRDGSDAEIGSLIRSSGCFNQKRQRLRTWAQFFLAIGGELPSRSQLLAQKGIGPETADSIRLYAYGCPCFIADAYARRIWLRIQGEALSYDELARRVEDEMRGRSEWDCVEFFIEIHALLVELGKRCCRTRPLCQLCSVNHCCAMGQTR